MIENLKLYFPYVANDAIKYEEVSFYELLVTTKDGNQVIYDDLNKTITSLRFIYSDPDKDSYTAIFGMRLRKIMREKRITQEEIAEAIGVSQSTFNKYLHGDVSISLSKACKIADILGCSLDDFFYN